MNTEGYDIGNKIGSGAYGEVFKATNKATGEIVAIKKLKSEIIEDGIPATALREIVFLKQLSHENIVALKDIIMEPGKYLLVFEYMDGDLFYLLKNTPNPLGPDLVQSYTSQLLHGLAYCHALGVMHRDLKPQNLLIAKDGSLKIADFGLSRAFSFKNLTVEVVTSWYRAPEILLGSNSYTNSVDVWSAGCIICEMARNKVLFEGKCDIDQIHLIFNAFGTPNDSEWPGLDGLPHWRNSFPLWAKQIEWDVLMQELPKEGRELVEMMLRVNPSTRISSSVAAAHEFARNRYAT